MKSSTYLNGVVVRSIRREKGLTLRQLSTGAGVRIETLCRLELGKRPAAKSSIRKIADALGVTPEHITVSAQAE